MRTPHTAVEALRALPCGARALAAIEAHPGSWLVGGAVRDALLGREPREIDIATEHDPAALAAALGASPEAEHSRFGTLSVQTDDGCSFDVARARSETYPQPGALPDVAPAGMADDLRRRDFTVNAIALSPAGEALAVGQALEDLEAGLLRVLHPESFRDDPTRLWRMVRYGARLGFTVEAETLAWAREAVESGALQTVSGDRIGNEIRLALCESDPVAAIEAAAALGLTSELGGDRALFTAAAALLPHRARRDLTALATMLQADDPRAWLDRHGFAAGERRIVLRALALDPVRRDRPSQVAAALRGEPAEAVAVAGARGDAGTAASWLTRWSAVALEITGDDLLAAGIAPGPDIGARLARVLALRLDGALAPGREAELAAALAP